MTGLKTPIRNGDVTASLTIIVGQPSCFLKPVFSTAFLNTA